MLSAAIASTATILSKQRYPGSLIRNSESKVTLVFVSAPRRQLSLPFMGHPPILLGTISMVDSVILMIMALVVFGPRRLPQIGRQIGKLMYEFRKASNDFKFQMEEELRNSEEADRRKKEEETQRSLAAEQASVSADPTATVQKPASPDAIGTQYPEQYPAETPSTEAGDTESAPRIQPPSVGETVSRPARATSQSQPLNGTPDEASSGLPDQPPGEASSSSQNPPEPTETAEALNQHG